MGEHCAWDGKAKGGKGPSTSCQLSVGKKNSEILSKESWKQKERKGLLDDSKSKRETGLVSTGFN